VVLEVLRLLVGRLVVDISLRVTDIEEVDTAGDALVIGTLYGEDVDAVGKGIMIITGAGVWTMGGEVDSGSMIGTEMSRGAAISEMQGVVAYIGIIVTAQDRRREKESEVRHHMGWVVVVIGMTEASGILVTGDLINENVSVNGSKENVRGLKRRGSETETEIETETENERGSVRGPKGNAKGSANSAFQQDHARLVMLDAIPARDLKKDPVSPSLDLKPATFLE